MSASDGRSSADVEGEAEGVRAALAHTLDQLRDNLKPGNVVEEVVSNARLGASTLADHLYQLARDNPFPALLVGLGATMIFGLGTKSLSSIKPSPKSTPTMTPRRVAEPLSLGDVAVPVRTSGADPSLFATSRLTTARGRLPMASSNRTNSRRPIAPPEPSKLSGLLDDQPLIIAAIGVAVGAAVGAALPSTRVENQWVGDSSSSLRRAASNVARQEIDEFSDVVGRTAQSVKQSASDRGLSAENMTGLVKDVGEHAKSAIHDVGSHAADDVKAT